MIKTCRTLGIGVQNEDLDPVELKVRKCFTYCNYLLEIPRLTKRSGSLSIKGITR